MPPRLSREAIKQSDHVICVHIKERESVSLPAGLRRYDFCTRKSDIEQ